MESMFPVPSMSEMLSEYFATNHMPVGNSGAINVGNSGAVLVDGDELLLQPVRLLIPNNTASVSGIVVIFFRIMGVNLPMFASK
jgi:hypothetical protein